MSRIVCLSLPICLLALLASGCRSTSTTHAKANPAPPSSFWTADHSAEATEVTATGSDGQSVRFATSRNADRRAATITSTRSRDTENANRIPFLPSPTEELRRIDPPRSDSTAISIGAF